MCENSNQEQYYLQEYQSLRAEKLQRYEFANKLNERLITSTIALWTLAVAIFAVFNFRDFSDPDFEVIIIRLECLEVILMILPMYISKYIFNASQNNSIRIHLISDYLRKQSHFLSLTYSWESMKSCMRKMYYFYDFRRSEIGDADDAIEGNQRVGELTQIHRIISYLSLVLSGALLLLIAINCLPIIVGDEYTSIITIISIISVAIPLVSTIVTQTIIAHSYSDKKKRTLLNTIKLIVAILFILASFIFSCIYFSCSGLAVSMKSTLWMYVFTYIVYIFSTILIPCYKYRHCLVVEIIEKNSKVIMETYANGSN